jgi:uncharacterized protein YuzE
VRLVVSYDPEAGCAYVQVGAFRYSDRTVELDSDTLVDYDERGDVVGVEFLGVSTPEITVLRRRQIADVPLEGDML